MFNACLTSGCARGFSGSANDIVRQERQHRGKAGMLTAGKNSGFTGTEDEIRSQQAHKNNITAGIKSGFKGSHPVIEGLQQQKCAFIRHGSTVDLNQDAKHKLVHAGNKNTTQGNDQKREEHDTAAAVTPKWTVGDEANPTTFWHPVVAEMIRVCRKVNEMEEAALANYDAPSTQELAKMGFVGRHRKRDHWRDAKHRCRITIISQLSPQEAHIFQSSI